MLKLFAVIASIFVISISNVEAKPRIKHKNIVNKATINTVVKSNDTVINKVSSFINSTARQLRLPPTLWCADFMNLIFGGSNRMALSYTSRGTAASHGCIGCVAVTKRRGGGHVGVVKGYDKSGNPILISGNHSNRVGVGTYSKHAVVAYRYVNPKG